MATVTEIHNDGATKFFTLDIKCDGQKNEQNEEAVKIEPEPVKSRSRLRLFAILGALFLSLFIAALDMTIVATAIPTITSQFHSANGYTWIGGAYLLANAASGPIWANLSDIWGRKAITLIAVAFFFAGSIICAVSVNMAMLIGGRVINGIAGGGLIVLVNIVISDLFSVRTRSLYIGLLEFMWALVGGVGPVLGGAFTQYISWRWIFWINLPISGIAFLLLLLFLDVHNPRTEALEGLKAIDWLGSLSMLMLTTLILLGLNLGGVTYPWNSPTIICLFVVGALMTAVFVYSEMKVARYPLMPPRLFRHWSTVASLVVVFAHGFVWIGSEYYLPLYFQSVMESSPLRSGVMLVPYSLGGAVMGIVSGVVIHRTGRYLELIYLGLFLSALGNGLYITFSTTTPIGAIIAFEIIASIGVGVLFEPPLIALQALVSQDDVATTTATLNFFRSLATSCSVVIGGVVFQNGMQLQVPKLNLAGLAPDIVTRLTGSDAAANVMLVASIADLGQRAAVKEAFAWSLRNLWILYTVMGLVGAVASVFITREVLSKDHTETVTGLKKPPSQDSLNSQRSSGTGSSAAETV